MGILDEFAKIRADMEKIKDYNLERDYEIFNRGLKDGIRHSEPSKETLSLIYKILSLNKQFIEVFIPFLDIVSKEINKITNWLIGIFWVLVISMLILFSILGII